MRPVVNVFSKISVVYYNSARRRSMVSSEKRHINVTSDLMSDLESDLKLKDSHLNNNHHFKVTLKIW